MKREREKIEDKISVYDTVTTIPSKKILKEVNELKKGIKSQKRKKLQKSKTNWGKISEYTSILKNYYLELNEKERKTKLLKEELFDKEIDKILNNEVDIEEIKHKVDESEKAEEETRKRLEELEKKLRELNYQTEYKGFFDFL